MQPNFSKIWNVYGAGSPLIDLYILVQSSVLCQNEISSFPDPINMKDSLILKQLYIIMYLPFHFMHGARVSRYKYVIVEYVAYLLYKLPFYITNIHSMSARRLNSMWRRSLTAVLSGQGWIRAPTFPKLMAAANLVNKFSVEQSFMWLQL